MKHFLERAKEFIETLDYEDPKYDFMVESIGLLQECGYTMENLKNYTDEELNRLNIILNIAEHQRRMTKQVLKIMEER